MKLDGNRKLVIDVEEYMIKELKKKKETMNLWFEQSEENKDDKKNNWDSKKNKSSGVKINRHVDGK